MARQTRPLLLAASAALLAACGAGAPAAPAESLVLTVTGRETSPDGRTCAFDVSVRNGAGTDVVNVQTAYMASTARGNVSEYVVLGDFLNGEERSGRLFVSDTPCADVESLELVRAVCTIAPAASPAESCAESVWLDGGGVVDVVIDE